MTIDQKVNGKCPSCNEETTFKFRGVQEGYKHIPPMRLYDCGSCKTTIKYKNIKQEKL